MQPRISSCLLSITAGMTLALSGLVGAPGWTGEAQAATNGSIIGEVEAITVVDPTDKWSAGTITVGGQIVTIPRNLLMDLPANRLTLQELYYVYAPTACLASGKSGLAKGDLCNAYGTGANVSISANRTAPGGNLIAGDVFIQKGAESFAGQVTYINHDEGYFRLGGTLGDPTNGVMVRLNDPDSRHTIQTGLGCALGTAQAGLTNNCSPDVRFTLDPDNYTNVFTTGYPMCIPSTVSRSFVDVLDLNTNNDVTETLLSFALPDGTLDRLCPLTNRTVNNGLPVDDSRRFAPIRLGDNIVADGNWEIINGTRFLSAHSTMVSAALTTKNLPDQPDYLFLNEVEIDVAGFQNQRARTLIIGFVTLVAPTADVLIWSLHYDPVNNAPHELPLASVVGCELASGAGSCAAQGLGGVAGNNIFKMRHDVDFNVGADPKLNPCAHLLDDPRMPRVCNNNATGTNIGEMLGILSPIPHEIQARTGHKVLFGTGLVTLDINGLEATNGQYLFPFGINLGGISTPEFDEIDLNAMATPLFFSGIPWNLDRRLSPGGCDGPCEGTPQPLTPFPYEGLDPRTQTNLPLGLYNDPIFTDASLADVRNRILTFVTPTGRANGNATVLAHPPVNPAAFAIAATPNPVGTGSAPQAPVITSAPVLTASAGVPYSYPVVATDANAGDIITYSLLAGSFPTGMTIDATLGLISWTPTLAQVGPQAVNLRATDQGGLFGPQAFIITVAAPAAPTAANDPFATAAGVTLIVAAPGVLGNDTNPSPLPLTATPIAAGPTTPAGSGTVTLNANGSFTYTPAAAFSGPATFTYQATNGTLSNVATVTITVAAAPAAAAPVITSTPSLTGTEGVAYSYQVTATDVNGGPFTFALDAAPAGMTISATGLVSWTPAAGQVGANAVTVRVTDNTALFATQPFSVTVAAAAQVAPVITSTAVTTATVGVAYSYQVTATDVNGGPFTFALDAAPAGMTISATGLISWTPVAGQVGANAVTVRVTDNTALFATQPFSVTVAAAPAGPTITGFVLRNATTDTLFGTGVLTNGTSVSRAACSGCTFNMEALIVGTAGTAFNNVRLVLTGPAGFTTHNNNEGAFPFTKPGDNGVGNYNGLALPIDGSYTLTATPRTNTGATIGTPLSVTFTVTP